MGKHKAEDKEPKSTKDKEKESTNLVNKPPNKRGKFKKDFNDRIDKIMAELELNTDKNGKIKMKNTKKEKFGDYQANINPIRFKDADTKGKDDELYLFKQNKMKKPKTESQQKKKDKLLKNQRENPALEKIGDFGSDNPKREKPQKEFNKPKWAKNTEPKSQESYPRREKGEQKDSKEGRKSKFVGYEDYYDISQVQEGLDSGELFQGVYIRNEKNPMQSFIKCPQIIERIFFTSQHDENRAMHNSIVVFRIRRGKPTLISQPQNQIPLPGESSSEEENNKIILEEEVTEEEKINPEHDGFEDTDDEELDLQKIAEMNMEDIPIDDSVSEDADEENSPEDELDIDDEEQEDDDEEEIEEEEEEKEDLKVKQANRVINFKPNKKNFKTDSERENLKDEPSNRPARLYGEIVYIVDNPQFHRKFVVTLKKNPYGGIVYRGQPIEKQLLPFELITFSPDNSNNVDSYYLAEYLYWPPQARFPYGHIIEEIGDAGLVEVETDALLKNYGVYNQDFTSESYEFLKKFDKNLDPVTGHFVPTEEDRKQREDLTTQIVVTCDPKTARDLDDALSIKKIEDDVYEIGVHIADVAHFVEEGSPLDDEARLRTTSVYLVQRAIPMLPHLLSQNLCSLNPGVEKFTFSCFFYVKEDGTVLEDRAPRITKSIIRCCVRFDYDMMQEVIEGKITDEKDLPVQFYPGNHVKGDIISSCLKMNEIAQKIRKRRFDKGSISFERSKLRFKLGDKDYPVGIQEDIRKDSNCMVEEYMLLANKFVGKFIVDTCSEIGVLRCHPSPTMAKISILENILKKLNLTMDFTSSKTIHDSCQKILSDETIPKSHRTIVQTKLARILEAARYFVVEDTPAEEWKHFALSFDIYTHFTSPIRRYPDVLVHRLAEKCLAYKSEVRKHINKYHMLSIMDKCNSCKLNAKRVSDASQKLFTCLYMRNNPQHTEAIIMFINLQYVELFVPFIDHEKKIFFKDLKCFTNSKMTATDKGNQLEIEFKPEGKSPITLKIKEFDPVNVYVSGTDKYPIDFTINFAQEIVPGQKTILY